MSDHQIMSPAIAAQLKSFNIFMAKMDQQVSELKRKVEHQQTELAETKDAKEKEIADLNDELGTQYYITTDMCPVHVSFSGPEPIIWTEIVENIEKISSSSGPGSAWLRDTLNEIVKNKNL